MELSQGQARAMVDHASQPTDFKVGDDVYIPLINKHGYIYKVLPTNLRIRFVDGTVTKTPKYMCFHYAKTRLTKTIERK